MAANYNYDLIHGVDEDGVVHPILVNADGSLVGGAGGGGGGTAGTEYTEGATDATITGTAILWEDVSNTLRVPSALNPFPVEVIAGGGGVSDATAANQTAGNITLTSIDGHVDGIETLIGTTNTALTSIDGHIDGLEASATSINGKLTDVATAANQSTEIAGLAAIDGHVDGLEAAIGAAADVAATADTGTFSLIAIAKRIVAKLTAIAASVAGATPAGELHIGEVAGSGNAVKVPLTVSTTPAYTAGDSIGGKMTIANAVRVAGGLSILASLQILDRANQKPSGTILLYDADPTAATLTDNAAVVNSTDDLKVIAQIPVAASDYVTINSKAYANPANLARVVKAVSGTNLYAAFVVTGTPTFAAATDVQIVFDFVYIN